MTFSSSLHPHSDHADTRTICVLFVDLVGSTHLSLSMPLPAFSDLMSDVLQIMMLTCEASGGEVLPHQGDAIVSLWDAEQAARATNAAEQLHTRLGTSASVRRLGLDLRVRVGVSCGEAILGKVSGNLTAFGPPMSLARRLCDGARPGQTLVCGETSDRLPQDRTVPLGVRSFPDFPLLRVARLHAIPSHMRMKSS